MAFNLQALMDDPQFQMGIGLLGSAGGPYTGLLKTYEILQARKHAEIEAQEKERQRQLQQIRLEQEKQQLEQYTRQNALAERRLSMEERQREDAMKALPDILRGFGVGDPAQSQTEVPPPTQTAPVVPQTQLSPKPLTPAAEPVIGSDLFSMADAFVEKVEGGKTTDTGGRTNFGISKKWNPDIDVDKLTPEQAREIRKERYWDALPELSKLTPEAAFIAYDSAINQGIAYTKRMLRETGGVPARMIAHRSKRYESTVASNPDKYGKYADGWNNRMEQLAQAVEEFDAPKLAAVTGSPEKQAQTATKNVQLAADSKAPRLSPNDPAVAIAKSQIAAGKVTEGLQTLAQAHKAAKDAARQAQLDAQRQQTEAARLSISQEQLRLQQQEAVAKAAERAATISSKQEEAAAKKQETAQKRTVEQATALKSYQTTEASLSSLREKTNELLQHKGSPFIFGLQGLMPTIPGTTRADAKALHTSVVKQLAQETLQAIRQGSPTGGALGNVSDKDIQLLETSLRNLERAQSWPSAQKQLREVLKYVDKIQGGYRQHYETLYGELPKATTPTQPAANQNWGIRRIR